MNTNKTERLILRRENFGGILFNPRNGNQLELDHAGFDAAIEFFVNQRQPDRGFHFSFLKKIHERVGDIPPNAGRLVEPATLENSEFRVLRSPSLADIQITSACTQGCPHCYASANPKGKHIPYSDLCNILNSCANAGVFQIALGGGDPLLHPDFEKILHAVRERGMVPNVTTSGAYFTESNLAAMRECCGAVALSLEGVGKRYSQRRSLGWKGFCDALDTLSEHSIPTVLQVTVGAKNINDVSSIVDFALSKNLYGVIFLAYKPVGRGERFDGPLSKVPNKKVSEVFSKAFVRLSSHTRVGFDCCLSAIVAGLNHDIFGASNSELDGCSALRGSIGVSVDQKLAPCTFTEHLHCGSLKEHSVSDLWRNSAAQSFRKNHEASVNANPVCSPCAHKRTCMGGCPVYDLGRCGSYKEPQP
jgi:radical SAM protein with 4Fe4S-binding SPASM domain